MRSGQKLLIAILLSIYLIALLSCSKIPHGKDGKGFYLLVDSCVESHVETSTSVSPAPIGVHLGNGIYLSTTYENICDKSILVKHYLKPNQINKDFLKGYNIKK